MHPPSHRARAARRVLIALFALLPGAAALAQSTDHHPDAGFHPGFEAIAAGPTTDGDAARFLTQATFGPTLADIQHLRQVGYSAWLAEQFAAPTSLEVPYLNWVETLPQGQNEVYQDQRIESWLINSLGTADPSNIAFVHKDQLRQRVAFALSEIFVISDRNGALTYEPWTMASYYDLLATHAFGNYRTLLEDVTKHPAMGIYLSMIGNRKPDAALNIRPDENYAREINQLFSVGLVQLNLDGTPKLAGGQPIPTYAQDVVRGFAHVFTGWIWNGCAPDEFDYCGPSNPDELQWQQPMQPIEAYHDDVEDKQLLDYPGVALANGVLVHGGSAQAELTAALDNIFHHPNVGPFVSKQLIQRLVTSNPTPAYVQRVATVFNDNGSGVRGDLGAVVKAILLDPEARYGQWQQPDTFGKLREPMLKLTHLWRAMGAHSQSGRLAMQDNFAGDNPFGQRPLDSPTVFNFFRPNFQQPGEIRTRGYVSPEFQIATDTQVVSSANELGTHLFYFFPGSTEWFVDANSVIVDPSRDTGLTANPSQLLDRYNMLFMSGQMSPFMHDTIRVALEAMSAPEWGPGDPDLASARVQQALYLILNSPEYSAQK